MTSSQSPSASGPQGSTGLEGVDISGPMGDRYDEI